MSYFYQRRQPVLKSAVHEVLQHAQAGGWDFVADELSSSFIVCKRDFTSQQRKAAAKTGEAMADGSFPIGNAEDLHHAISLVAFSNHPESEVRAHIMRRAKALGIENELPKSWGGKNKSKKKP